VIAHVEKESMQKSGGLKVLTVWYYTKNMKNLFE